jgi:hypothetical protein
MRNLLIAILALLSLPGLLLAQATIAEEGIPVTKDFLVSPANVELLVKPGESRTFTLRITNRTGAKQKFTLGSEALSSEAYSDAGETDQAVSELASLEPYLKASPQSFDLEHGQTIEVPVSVDLPNHVNEPSLYALITVTTAARESQVTNAPAARVLSRIGVPVLVRTSDERHGEGRLVDFGTADGSRIFTGKTVNLRLSYENVGDVHIRPMGKVTLKNVFGAVAGEVAIEPWYILPGSIRSRTLELPTHYHFGYYSASVAMKDDYGQTADYAKTTFWILPHETVLVLVVIIVLATMITRVIRRRGVKKSLEQ